MPSTAFKPTPAFLPTLLTLNTTTPPTPQLLSLQLTPDAAKTTKPTLFSGFKQKTFVTTADIPFGSPPGAGSVLHIVDSVLTLPGAPSTTARNTADLTSFFGALAKTALLDAVDASASSTTIFAPSNAAFEAVGSVVQTATAPVLAGVLRYHVLKGNGSTSGGGSGGGGAVFSPALVGTAAAKTGLTVAEVLATLDPGGRNVTVRVDGATGDVFVNSARVVTRDIITSSGVIHILDK